MIKSWRNKMESLNWFIVNKCVVTLIMQSYMYLCLVSIIDFDSNDAIKIAVIIMLILILILTLIISISKFDIKYKFPYTLAYYSDLQLNRQARLCVTLGLLRNILFALIVSNIFKARSQHRINMLLQVQTGYCVYLGYSKICMNKVNKLQDLISEAVIFANICILRFSRNTWKEPKSYSSICIMIISSFLILSITLVPIIKAIKNKILGYRPLQG